MRIQRLPCMTSNSRIAANRIIHVNTISGGASANENDIASAIWSLYYAGVKIINVSWQGTGLSNSMAQTITQNGTTLVLAGGNTTTAQQHVAIADVPGVIDL